MNLHKGENLNGVAHTEGLPERLFLSEYPLQFRNHVPHSINPLCFPEILKHSFIKANFPLQISPSLKRTK